VCKHAYGASIRVTPAEGSVQERAGAGRKHVHVGLASSRMCMRASFSICTKAVSSTLQRRAAATHILTVLSRPPLTILSATKSTQYTSSVWPGRSFLIL
jgi:hypothetical protein